MRPQVAPVQSICWSGRGASACSRESASIGAFCRHCASTIQGRPQSDAATHLARVIEGLLAATETDAIEVARSKAVKKRQRVHAPPCRLIQAACGPAASACTSFFTCSRTQLECRRHGRSRAAVRVRKRFQPARDSGRSNCCAHCSDSRRSACPTHCYRIPRSSSSRMPAA